MFKANKFLAITALFLFVLIMESCGGGGGGGDSGGTGTTPPTTQGDLSQYSAGDIEDPNFNGIGINEGTGISTSNDRRRDITITSETCGPMGTGFGGYAPNNCTEWVVVRRCEKGDSPVIWHGNGGEWLVNAASVGYETATVPKVGAIAVFKLSYDPCPGIENCKNKALYLYGHVAYVENIDSSGGWCISEYNYINPLAYGERCFSPNNTAPALIGFIYGPKTLSSTDTVPPSTPTGLTGNAISSSRIYLSWTASTDNVGVAGYKVYRNGYYHKSVPTTFAYDTELSPSFQYCYTISAYDAIGNESFKSNQKCITTFSSNTCGGISSPDNPFTCCANGGNCTWWAWYMANSKWNVDFPSRRNAMHWADDARMSGYPVSSTPAVDTIAVNTTQTVDGIRYGHVAWVEEVSGDQVRVSEMNCCDNCGYGPDYNKWRPINYFDGGFIYPKSTTGSQSDLTIQNLSGNPPSGPLGSGITVSFTIYNQGSGTANASTANIRINISSSGVTTSDPLLDSISVPSIAPGDTYNVSQSVTIPSNRPSGTNYIWVILDVNSTANQSNEMNDKANTVFTITSGNQPPGSFTLSATLECSGEGTPQIRLTWMPSLGVDYYNIYKNGSLYEGVSSNVTTFVDTAVTTGMTYSYFIRAINSGGQTDSNVFNVTATCQGVLPGAFTLSAIPWCDGNKPIIKLEWTGSAGRTFPYEVYRNGYLLFTTDSNTYDDTAVIAGTSYGYFVRAKNSAGSRDSNPTTITAKTDCGAPVAPLINTVSPQNVIVGDGSFTLTISGQNFDQTCYILYDFSDPPYSIINNTSFVNSSTLTAEVTQSSGGFSPFINPANYYIQVLKPGSNFWDGQRSNTKLFMVYNPLPVISSITGSCKANLNCTVANGFDVRINGSGFVNNLVNGSISSSYAEINGSSTPVSLIGQGPVTTQMQLSVNGSLIPTPGTYSIKVCNAGTLQGTSCSTGSLNVIP